MKIRGISAIVAAAVIGAMPASAAQLYVVNDSNNELGVIDTTTFAYTTVGSLGAGGDFGDLASNGSTLWWLGGRSNNTLYTVDTATGAASEVGIHGVNDLFSLAYNPLNDTLYAAQFAGGTSVYTLDKNTGAATFLSSGVGIGGMTFNSSTGTLVGTNDGSGAFYAIDPATGAQTLLNNTAGGNNDSDFAYDSVENAYWMGDWSGNLYRYDATTYSRTLVATYGFAIDGVAIMGNATPAVPEPATWGMMIAGLGLMGGLMRRRSATTATQFA